MTSFLSMLVRVEMPLQIEHTGKIPFTVGSESFFTKYWAFGDMSLGRPLICVHGGPGIPSTYMRPFATLASEHGIPVIIYDQIGCGQSALSQNGEGLSHFSERDSAFWTVALFIDELMNLIEYMNVDTFDLLGHSRGGMICSELAAKRKPCGLRNLILANSLAWMGGWCSGNIKLLQGSRISANSVHVIQNAECHPGHGQEIESRISLQSTEYITALREFQHTFTCQMDPWPTEFLSSLEQANTGNVVHLAMYVSNLNMRPLLLSNPIRLGYTT
ncbi:proline-specific peptidase [Penicillium lagena]|uniref:proline-specific peptidase n=1 Tax=Penicillium lagena TaxID=94218 RepID=UPI002541AAB0|nr:proline-specific peptidase [Penicillium lagena]KAJ5621158.1 proline-specific peptidase [Penicillium lagena]